MVVARGKAFGLVGMDFLIVSIRVGNGKRIQFWHNVWCGDQSLHILFVDLYSTAVEKDYLCIR